MFLLVSLVCALGSAPATADDRNPSRSELERTLEGTKRVLTTDKIPAAFSAAVRREYDASQETQSETQFERYLANRYFWTMEAIELRTGTYVLPQRTRTSNPMCADGACDGPLDPNVWDGAWTGGSPANIAGASLPIATWTPGIFPNDNSIPDGSCGTHASQAHHSIVPSGPDPEFPGQLMTVAPTPVSNPASLRLGNRCKKYGGERISKTFPVVAGQTTLQFWYSMVFQNPLNHTPAVQPGFGAYLYSAGSAIPNRIDLDSASPGLQDFVYANASNPFFGHKGTGDSTVVYSAWTCVTVDLSGLEGQTLTLILANRDCGLSGHWGYTYVDSFCLGCALSATGDATFNAAASDCVNGQLCFDYTVPTATNGTTGVVDLSLTLYQSGAVVTTLTSGPLATNGTHCFTLPMSSLNMSLGGYDWSAKATFTLGTATISPIQIGNAPNGQTATPGQNDDCLWPEPDPCVALVREGHADESCGYHLTLNPTAGWQIGTIQYGVASGGATVQSLSATPCAHTTTPSNLAGTTSGTLAFSPPCGQALTLDVAAGGATGSGPVCVDLVVWLVKGAVRRQCRTQVCFPCRPTTECPGTLCVYKFNDANGDGVQQIGEAGVPTFTFLVSGSAGGTSLTTNASGVACTSLPPGTYTVVEQAQSGWTATTATTQTVTLTAGQISDVKFGNRRGGGGDKLGKLCVFKFLDTNGSRRQDFGELPLSGWTFEVRDTAGNVVATLVTDAQGGFCTAVPAGVYTVTETPQVGYTPTTPPTQTITVPAGQSVTAVFGNRQTGEVGLGKLCVFKFHDTDGSRRQDPGELPLSGWTFDVRDAAGTSVATLTTDAQGWFCTAMPAGTYTVTETPQAGYTPTTPTTQTVTVIAGQSITATFGNRKGDKPGDEGQLCIHKFLDENGTGKQDPGETSLGGWIFQVRNAAGVVATLTSDARRDVCTRLPAGTYTVTETPQTGYTATTPTTQPATVVAGQSTTVIFGNRKGDTPGGEGQLCIHKFLDENRNGRQDLGEAALGGFTFQVRNAAGVVTTLMSDARRDVCTRLPAGTYAITETPLTGYTPTTPTTQTATVTAGQTTTVTFGNRKGDQPGGEGQLCVHKFLDENGNGIQDAGELALAGWTFEVRNAAGAVVAKLTTDGKGNACTRLSAGAYTVTEVPLPGYTPTTPPTQSVTVTPNRTTDATFGNRKGGR